MCWLSLLTQCNVCIFWAAEVFICGVSSSHSLKTCILSVFSICWMVVCLYLPVCLYKLLTKAFNIHQIDILSYHMHQRSLRVSLLLLSYNLLKDSVLSWVELTDSLRYHLFALETGIYSSPGKHQHHHTQSNPQMGLLTKTACQH